MNKIPVSLICIGLLALAACSSNDHGIKVTKSEYGTKWPFTVDEGYIDCVDNQEVVFRTGRKVYSLSGATEDAQKYLNIEYIWKEDPQVKGTKILLYPFIEKGLKICH
ncbi:MAG: DUF2511 domain-containing protein [Bacteroidota bacterium]